MSIKSQVSRRGDEAPSKSLGVALGAEPRDLALAVDPLVRIFLAGKTCDGSLLATRIVGLDGPIIVCDSDDPEGHFCFCHEALCSLLPEIDSVGGSLVSRPVHPLDNGSLNQ